MTKEEYDSLAERNICFLEGEVWKEISSPLGIYKISNKGRLMNKETGNILRPRVSKNGYWCIPRNVRKDIKINYFHQAVATYFIINDCPELKKVINHINGIKCDNEAANLEWCTSSYNNKDAYATGLKKAPNVDIRRGVNQDGKIFYQFDLSGKFIRSWTSVYVCEQTLWPNNKKMRNLFKGLIGEYKTIGGFIFSYEDRINPADHLRDTPQAKTVYQYDLSGKFIGSFPSALAAGKSVGIDCTLIACVCRGKRNSAGGYMWTREYVPFLDPASKKLHIMQRYKS